MTPRGFARQPGNENAVVVIHMMHEVVAYLLRCSLTINDPDRLQYANALPCSLAWEAFREANGANSAQEMRARVSRYRRTDPTDRSDFEIGCRILTQPFFFEESDWIPAPSGWSPNIVSFKTHNTGDAEGLALPSGF